MISFKPAAAGIALLAAGQLASAAEFSFIDPTSWTRGDAGSLYLEWDAFDAPNGFAVATSPDIGSSNISSVVLDDLNNAGTVASSGNWYGFGGPMDFSLQVTGDSNGPTTGTVDAYLQLSVLGAYNNDFLLNGQTGNVTVLDTSVNGYGATNYHLLVDWTLAGANSFDLSFATAAAHVSLDSLSLDIGAAAVPVPAAAWLFATALLSLTGIRRKQA